MRTARVGLGVACAALALHGCRAPQPPREPTLTLAVRADVTGFFPGGQPNEAYTLQINRHVFEGLVGFDRKLEIVPALAARWETPDERTYVFELRPGLRFSDGTPVTAEDVAASLLAPRERGLGLRNYLEAIDSVRALGAARVEVRTRRPYRILLNKLPFGFVVPARSWVGIGPALGTGPYLLERHAPGKEFVLARNPAYRGPAPAFARARFVVVPDARERIARVESGEADLADQVPLDQIARLADRRDLRVIHGPGLRVIFLGMRVDRAPFSDPRVREALDLAIDRHELIRMALAERAEPAAQLVPGAVLGHDPAIAPLRPDRARARALLSAAGFPRGLELRLDGPSNRYAHDLEILDELKRQLEPVGVRVQINAEDKQDFFRRVYAGDTSLFLIGWSCESGDGGDVLDLVFHTPAEGRLGTDNFSHVSDAELDRLIERAAAAATLPDRAKALRDAMARAVSLRAQLPLLVQTEALLLSSRVAWEPPISYALRVEDMRPAR